MKTFPFHVNLWGLQRIIMLQPKWDMSVSPGNVHTAITTLHLDILSHTWYSAVYCILHLLRTFECAWKYFHLHAVCDGNPLVLCLAAYLLIGRGKTHYKFLINYCSKTMYDLQCVQTWKNKGCCPHLWISYTYVLNNILCCVFGIKV